MKHLSNVIAAIDFSKPSKEALKEAYRICQWDEASLVALYVVDREAANVFVKDMGNRNALPLDVVAETIRGAARRRVKHFVEESLPEGAQVHCKSVIGYPQETLLETVIAKNTDLLAIGNSGHGRGRSRIGTVAQRAVRRGPCHVLVVRGEHEKPFNHVLACIDFSENSKKAARHAIHIAQQDDAYLEFLHIVPPIDSLSETLEFADPLFPKVSFAMQTSVEREIRDALEAYVRPIIKNVGGIEQYRVHVQRAHPVREGILDYVEDCDPDLVVVGATGKTGIGSLLLGTTAEAIIHHSPCSVLTIREDGFDYQE